ncbi:YsnF/AvaK domain-containing protein [Thiohalomonas denitrificans]|uniref:DUF2382 domain-containing protein n=1 Tax=Thiohalomonas denitrificans TaxID=415747 RepID=A0A1G5QKG5_9GAMM|nr:YsnF/AvaK domain-containing protein [Thiohalomonas denitrificans]SCZ62345.1 protein of unknown function [Thiohalomonas denitrificans]
MTAKTLLGLFKSKAKADSATQDLMHEGFSARDIEVRDHREFTKEPGPEESGLHAFLREMGLIGGDGEHAYKEGDYLVKVDADDTQVDRAADILNRHGALDVDQRAAAYKKEGKEAPEKLESIEEELKIGTRPVSRGGVRIYTRPTERNVQESVSLHEEDIHVERHPTDRPAREKDTGAFKEQSFEVRAKGEEPVVGKEARVKEEVEISKEEKERKEVVHETLRGTKVEVEKLGPEAEASFRNVETEFQDDYNKAYSGTGADYQDVLPAYRYGYRVGHDPYYRDGDWGNVEPKVRKDWEDHNYPEWDFYKPAVHRGWESGIRH